MTSSWTQVGSDINGEATGDKSGHAIISSDGLTLAIGGSYNDENGKDSGHVRVFKNINNTWTQIGSDIDGEAAGDKSGGSGGTSISGDGSVLAIGGLYNDENGQDSGHVRVFKLKEISSDELNTAAFEISNTKIIEKITSTITTDINSYSGDSSDYKFFNLGQNRYAIQAENSYDEITGVSTIKFTNKDFDLSKDIKGVFDQVTGLNTDSGEMFRLYNAAFARFPDADGLKYWIDQFSSGKNTRRVVAQSFLGSAEFTEKYGSNVSNETYVNNLYKNVLGRDADTEGLNYWVGNLSSGVETRYEALLGFAESAENKALFTEMTGFA